MAEYERFDRCITFAKDTSITTIDVKQIIGFEVSETETYIRVEFFTPYTPQGEGLVFFKECGKGEGEAELMHNAIFEFLQSKAIYLNLNSIDFDALREKVERSGKLTRALKAMR
jgi:hypothetical protein